MLTVKKRWKSFEPVPIRLAAGSEIFLPQVVGSEKGMSLIFFLESTCNGSLSAIVIGCENENLQQGGGIHYGIGSPRVIPAINALVPFRTVALPVDLQVARSWYPHHGVQLTAMRQITSGSMSLKVVIREWADVGPDGQTIEQYDLQRSVTSPYGDRLRG